MGQILNRIYRIAKSWANESDIARANREINSDDEELKRIIEELNKEKKEQKQRAESRNNESRSQESAAPKKMSLSQAYGLLGINSGAGLDEIKAAYRVKVKEYHPDRVAALGEELRELAAKKTLEINEAYSMIKKNRNF